MSLGDVADGVRRAANTLPTAALAEAGDRLDEASTIFFRATEGTSDPEVEQVLGEWRQAREGIDELLGVCDKAKQTAFELADQLGAQAARPPNTSVTPVRTPSPTGAHKPRARLGKLVDASSPYHRAAETLARPVDGGATQGLWINELGGTESWSSGEHGPGWLEAVEFAQRIGLVRPGGIPTFARHLEIKFAAKMRAAIDASLPIRRYETIVIDRPPCGVTTALRRSCDELLPRFLPPGTELTIVERDGTTYTYRGAGQR